MGVLGAACFRPYHAAPGAVLGPRCALCLTRRCQARCAVSMPLGACRSPLARKALLTVWLMSALGARVWQGAGRDAWPTHPVLETAKLLERATFPAHSLPFFVHSLSLSTHYTLVIPADTQSERIAQPWRKDALPRSLLRAFIPSNHTSRLLDARRDQAMCLRAQSLSSRSRTDHELGCSSPPSSARPSQPQDYMPLQWRP